MIEFSLEDTPDTLEEKLNALPIGSQYVSYVEAAVKLPDGHWVTSESDMGLVVVQPVHPKQLARVMWHMRNRFPDATKTWWVY